ncbi:hypothetical protein IMZ16_04035 [Cruoricaptor ignavus]|uniref:Uncharacterized protein n=1 Tax=Cruoricaptor ignavus TaxID=1118202 RepID=A0A7M1T6W1_9FLAO|nr:hypothetical protein [Cruoricaptor ignavus]QOR74612.1 hypothetical protein IMZ16_04035 [Cruoricaptor ignavus]
MKKHYRKAIETLNRNPKQFYKISLILIAVSMVLSITQYFLFPESSISMIPKFSNNEKLVNVQQKYEKKEQKMKMITEELQILRDKASKSQLSADDSLRIKYLLQQYESVKK